MPDSMWQVFNEAFELNPMHRSFLSAVGAEFQIGLISAVFAGWHIIIKTKYSRVSQVFT
jgi:hypothetical protein